MPSRKEVSSLRSLCVGSITLNIVRHGEMFKRHRYDEKVYELYKLLQFFFTDDIIAKFFEILNQNSLDEALKLLKNFMFLSKEPGYPEEWPCLEFFFNEYANSLFPPLINRYAFDENLSPFLNHSGIFVVTQTKLELPEVILSFITAKCKNLRAATETFCFLAGKTIERIFPEFRDLQDVDLGFIENDDILKKVLQTCFGIRKLAADGRESISDKFLLSLCNHSSQSGKFAFCSANGECSKAGKCLESLHVTFCCSTGEGIACSLQHLPKLKNLAKLPLIPPELGHELPDLCRGIILLQEAATSAGRPPVILELNAIHLLRRLTPDQLRSVLMSCPKLEIVQVDLLYVNTSAFAVDVFTRLKELHLYSLSNEKLNSSDLKELLLARGKQIEVLSFGFSAKPLDLTSLNCVLESCCNLKSFSVHHVRITGRRYDRWGILPSRPTRLQKISLHQYGQNYFPLSCQNYFRELLCSAVNLKYLHISSNFAANNFFHIIGFKSLEKLSICCFERISIPFEQLLNTSDNLRTIRFCGPFCTDDFLLCKELARKQNYALEVVKGEF